jgi:hypothetical protein
MCQKVSNWANDVSGALKTSESREEKKMTNVTPLHRHIGVMLIDDNYSKPHAIIAAMMAAAHEAAAQIADGAAWETDEEIAVGPSAKPHALRMAQVWRYAANHLQGSDEALSAVTTRRAADLDRIAPNARRRSPSVP